MLERLEIWWEKLRTSLWPVPVAMIGLAVLLRELAVWIDAGVTDAQALQTWWLHSGSGDDARNLLSTLVAALITMASVMFSITMVVLSLAANQFGSRLVRTYMADIRTKLALGVFTMTIVYCMLVLRTVYKDMPPGDVPHVAVTLGLVLSLACILTLLFFLHVVARSMVAEHVIRRVAAELEASVEELPALAEQSRDVPAEDAEPKDLRDGAVVLTSRREGYVQAIDYDGLADVASRHGVVIRLHCKAGAFMCRDGWLAEVHPGDALESELAEAIRKEVRIGGRRTPTQDLEFSIRHLVDVALRALSPGINDPNTAIAVIDHLRGALSRLMGKRLPSTVQRDEAGAVRILGHDTHYLGILDAAFHQIRQAGAAQPSVVIHLLAAIGRIAEHVRLPEQRDALLHHLGLIADAGLRHAKEERDRKDIEERRAEAEKKLRRTSSRHPGEAADLVPPAPARPARPRLAR